VTRRQTDDILNHLLRRRVAGAAGGRASPLCVRYTLAAISAPAALCGDASCFAALRRRYRCAHPAHHRSHPAPRKTLGVLRAAASGGYRRGGVAVNALTRQQRIACRACRQLCQLPAIAARQRRGCGGVYQRGAQRLWRACLAITTSTGWRRLSMNAARPTNKLRWRAYRTRRGVNGKSGHQRHAYGGARRSAWKIGRRIVSVAVSGALAARRTISTNGRRGGGGHRQSRI